LRAQGDEKRHMGKAGAHNNRKTGTAPADRGKQLKQGCQTGNQERSLNQPDLITRSQSGYAGKDNCRSDAAHNHGNNVLKRQGEGFC